MRDIMGLLGIILFFVIIVSVSKPETVGRWWQKFEAGFTQRPPCVPVKYVPGRPL